MKESIEAVTPEECRDDIIKWLRFLALECEERIKRIKIEAPKRRGRMRPNVRGML